MKQSSVIAEGFPRRQDAFHSLPFRRIDTGGFCDATSSWPDYPKHRLALLLGLDRLIEVGVDAINLSAGYYNELFDVNEPLQIATQLAANLGIPVVVAAGNQGPKENSLQVIARAPWVVAVGAIDENGHLLRESSRGARNGACPTIVSLGSLPHKPSGHIWHFIDSLFPKPKGTSFAAPRVAPVAAITKRGLEIMAANSKAHQTGGWSGSPTSVKLITVGIADSGLVLANLHSSSYAERMWQEGSVKLFSRSTREYNWYSALASSVMKAGVECEPNVSLSVIKCALCQMARTLNNYQEYEVGSGFVDVTACINYFSTMLPSRWIELFCPVDTCGMLKNDLKVLDESLGPLWAPEIAQQLIAMLLSSLRIWFVRIIGTERELEAL